MSEAINALTAIWNTSKCQKDKKMPSWGKGQKWTILGQTGLNTAIARKEGRGRGKKEEEKGQMKGTRRRKEETVRKILTLLPQTHSVGAQNTHSRIKQTTKVSLNKMVLPCLSTSFFFHLQMMKHKWLRTIRSMRLGEWQRNLQTRSTTGRPFLTCTGLGVWVKSPRWEAWRPFHKTPFRRAVLCCITTTTQRKSAV